MNSSRMQKWYLFRRRAIFGFLNFDAKNSGWKRLGDGGRGAPQLRSDGPCPLDQRPFLIGMFFITALFSWPSSLVKSILCGGASP